MDSSNFDKESTIDSISWVLWHETEPALVCSSHHGCFLNVAQSAFRLFGCCPATVLWWCHQSCTYDLMLPTERCRLPNLRSVRPRVAELLLHLSKISDPYPPQSWLGSHDSKCFWRGSYKSQASKLLGCFEKQKWHKYNTGIYNDNNIGKMQHINRWFRNSMSQSLKEAWMWDNWKPSMYKRSQKFS